MEGPWSLAYYSPRHHGHHDPITLSEFPSSPSSSHYRVPFPELPDKCLDRMPEEYVWQQLNHPQYEHQPLFSDNVVWIPTGAISGDKTGGFPGNILHGHGVYEGNHICEHCRATFSRKQPPHLEHPNMGNGVPQIKLIPILLMVKHIVMKEDGFCRHQLNPRVEEAKNHSPGAGRLNDHYVLDGAGMNLPLGHASLADGHHLPSNYVHHRTGSELGNEVFHDQAVVASSHLHIPPEERGSLWRNVQNPTHGAPAHEACGLPQQVNDAVNSAFLKGLAEGSAGLCVATDNQNPWVESSQKMLGFDGIAVPDNAYAHPLKVNIGPHGQETQHSVTMEPVRSPQDMLNLATSTEPVQSRDQP
ncbi:hypothetical protein CRYUN_Cryun02cG0106900 [Craigia yunnanensis]